MDVQTGHVLQKLFSEGSLDNISVERLQQIVEEHPYFTFAQFLLARKLRDVSSSVVASWIRADPGRPDSSASCV